MSTNRYTVAGWLAVTLVPLYFITISIVAAQHVVAAIKGNLTDLPLGPGDVLAGFGGLVGAYLYIVFLGLLHERYNFHGADIYIKIAIGIDLVGAVIVLPLFYILEPTTESLAPLFIPILLFFGILNIQIARKILAAKNEFHSMIPAYATVLMISGICDVSIIFSFLSFVVLEPIALVILGMVFLREKEETEFV